MRDACGDERFDHLGVDHRAARRDLPDRPHQLVDVGDAFLQEVGPTLRAFVEELERVARLDVLAEHDDTDGGVGHAERLGRPHALVGAGRWHPDVGDHDIGLVLRHEVEERIEVFAGTDDLDVGVGVEQSRDSLAHEVVVFGDDDADRHGPRRLREPAPLSR